MLPNLVKNQQIINLGMQAENLVVRTSCALFENENDKGSLYVRYSTEKILIFRVQPFLLRPFLGVFKTPSKQHLQIIILE